MQVMQVISIKLFYFIFFDFKKIIILIIHPVYQHYFKMK